MHETRAGLHGCSGGDLNNSMGHQWHGLQWNGAFYRRAITDDSLQDYKRGMGPVHHSLRSYSVQYSFQKKSFIQRKKNMLIECKWNVNLTQSCNHLLGSYYSSTQQMTKLRPREVNSIFCGGHRVACLLGLSPVHVSPGQSCRVTRGNRPFLSNDCKLSSQAGEAGWQGQRGRRRSSESVRTSGICLFFSFFKKYLFIYLLLLF